MARIDLEGSRALESLPGALFFSRSDVQNFENVIFCRKKTAGGIVLNLKQGLGAAARPAAAAARPPGAAARPAWPGLAGPGRAWPGPGLGRPGPGPALKKTYIPAKTMTNNL